MSDLWGAINKKGKLVINPKFENALQFNNGLAPQEKIGFIEAKKAGNEVIEPHSKILRRISYKAGLLSKKTTITFLLTGRAIKVERWNFTIWGPTVISVAI